MVHSKARSGEAEVEGCDSQLFDFDFRLACTRRRIGDARDARAAPRLDGHLRGGSPTVIQSEIFEAQARDRASAMRSEPFCAISPSNRRVMEGPEIVPA